MGKAILEITDGTSVNTIDLLGRRFGYILCDWRPARPELEYATNRNWFSGTETPAQVIIKPTIDTFTFNARDIDVDTLIGDEQKLSHLLHMASLYWTGNRAVVKPFYIKARSKDETGIRYAAIYSAQLHDDSNPYAQPFFSRNPASTDLIVPVTHGTWLDYPPGTGGHDMRDNVISMLHSGLLNGDDNSTHFLGDSSRITLVNSLVHTGLTHMFYGTAFMGPAPGDTPDNILDKPEDIGYPLIDPGGKNQYTYFGMHNTYESVYDIKFGWPGIWLNITIPLRDTERAIPTSGRVPKWEVYFAKFGWTEVEIEDGTRGLTQPGAVLFKLDNRFWGDVTISRVSGLWVRLNSEYGKDIYQYPAVSVKKPAAVALPYFDILFDSDEKSPPEINPYIVPPAERAVNTIYPKFRIDTTSEGLRFDATPSIGNINYYRFMGKVGDIPFNEKGEIVSIIGVMDGDLIVDLRIAFDGDIVGSSQYALLVSKWLTGTETWQVFPEFNISNYTPRVGDNVTLSIDKSLAIFNTPSDTIVSSSWATGDVHISHIGATIQDATFVYTKSGGHSVTLLIEYASGRTVKYIKHPAVVTSYHETIASFTASNRRGVAPLSPGFDASGSTTTATSITSYAWTFGDGTIGYGARPDKTYTKRGVYSVRLIILDDAGNTDEVTYHNYIYIDEELSYPGDNGVSLEFGLSFTQLEWNFLTPNRVYIGVKPILDIDDYSFQPFIPVYGPNALVQPSNVSWSNVEIAQNAKSYTGYIAKYTHKSTYDQSEKIFATLGFDDSVYNKYAGTYRLFLRVTASTNINRGDFYFSARLKPWVTSYYYDYPELNSANRTRKVTDALHTFYITVMDLGSITFGGKDAIAQYLDIIIDPTVAPTDQEIRLYDIVLVPQDTWFTEISFPDFYFDNNNEIIVSSITPNGDLEAKIVSPSGNETLYIPATIPGSPVSLIGKDARFVVFPIRELEGGGIYPADPPDDGLGRPPWNPGDPSVPPHDDPLPRSRAVAPLEIPSLYSTFDTFFELSTIKKVNKYFSSRGKR